MTEETPLTVPKKLISSSDQRNYLFLRACKRRQGLGSISPSIKPCTVLKIYALFNFNVGACSSPRTTLSFATACGRSKDDIGGLKLATNLTR